MRPRDVIAFVNQCLSIAESQYQVTASMIQRAEVEYSRTRRDAMESEWRSAFPSLRKLLDFLAAFGNEFIDFVELYKSERATELAYAICAEVRTGLDPLYASAKSTVEGGAGDEAEFIKDVVSLLYRVGAIGVKVQANTRFLYSHLDIPLLEKVHIGDETRIRVHPILHASFHLRTREKV